MDVALDVGQVERETSALQTWRTPGPTASHRSDPCTTFRALAPQRRQTVTSFSAGSVANCAADLQVELRDEARLRAVAVALDPPAPTRGARRAAPSPFRE